MASTRFTSTVIGTVSSMFSKPRPWGRVLDRYRDTDGGVPLEHIGHTGWNKCTSTLTR